MPDGVNSLLIGKVGSSNTKLVLAGGNCSIQGLNSEGNDEFWTVYIFLRFMFNVFCTIFVCASSMILLP